MQSNSPGFLENVIGMPVSHARAFLNVAQSQKVVIIVRATGPTCHGLLEEGYDTKGYRIHGKSCDWGPMAGFVMRDPRLNKNGMKKEGFNREKHHEALVADHENQGWLASTTPLKISEARVSWLKGRGIINVTPKADRLDGEAFHPTGVRFKYSLIREGSLYGVYFDNSQVKSQWLQEKGKSVAMYHPRYGNAYEPMLAMTNPVGHGLASPSPHLNAITGDYDLFAVWPFVKDYNPHAYGDDHRPLGTVRGSLTPEEKANIDHLERNFTESGQGTKLGNITPRIYLICQLINSMVGRSVLWHSDEAARPFLDDVDLPVIAFTPCGNQFGIENIFDFQKFIANCVNEGIKVTLSNAWAQNATQSKPNRLGAEYAHFVPEDGVRIIVPDYYNR